MKDLISKKLLSLVLGEDVQAIDTESFNEHGCTIGESARIIIIIDDSDRILNLDTLGRLCKEYMSLQGFQIDIKVTECNGNYFVDLTDWRDGDPKYIVKLFKSVTELEAIILATTWVAEQKGLL